MVLLAPAARRKGGTGRPPKMLRSAGQETRRAPTREDGCSAPIALRHNDLIEKNYPRIFRLWINPFSVTDELVEP